MGIHFLSAIPRWRLLFFVGLQSWFTGPTLAAPSLFPASESPPTFVSTGSIWKYFDAGTNAGPGWADLSFDEVGWAAGPAQLGHGDGDEATIVGLGTAPFPKPITVYFRGEFSVTQIEGGGVMTLNLLRDDGAIVYLNGIEVFRSNMPEGPVTDQTLALRSLGSVEEMAFVSTVLFQSSLRFGRNVLAVEVHQAAEDSPDLSFDLELVSGSPNVTLPEVNVLVPDATAAEADVANGASPDPGFFRIERTGPTEEPLSVDYTLSGSASNGSDYPALSGNVVIPAGSGSVDIPVNVIDDTLVEEVEVVELTLLPSPCLEGPSPDANCYQLGLAVAGSISILDNDQIPTNRPPTVQIVSPVDRAIFSISEEILIEIFSVDPDGGTNRVEVFANDESLGMADFNPENPTRFRLLWRPNSLADYFLSAIAVDEGGDVAVSPTVLVIVDEPPTNGLPLVTVRATDPFGAEESSDPVVFRVTRSSISDLPLRLYYSQNSLHVPAIPRATFSSLPRFVDIPAGDTGADIVITPDDDTLVEGPETIEIRLVWPFIFAQGNLLPPYEFGEPSAAQAVIADNDSSPDRHLLSVDFGEGAVKRGAAAVGIRTNDYWNPHNQPSVANYESENLCWVEGIRTEIDLRVENAGGQWYNLTGDPMYDSYIYPNNGQGDGVGNMTVRLSSVPPGFYDLYLYGKADPIQQTWPRRESDSIFTLRVGEQEIGSAGTFASVGWTSAQPFREGYEYVRFRSVSVGEGEAVWITVAPGFNQVPGSGPEGPAVINGLQLFQVPAPPEPVVVTVQATDDLAEEGGTNSAVFTLTRTPVSDLPLLVTYTIRGTASNGVDYAALPGEVEIPAGAASAEVVVQPIEDGISEVLETVWLQIPHPVSVPVFPPLPPPLYRAGEPRIAGAVIIDSPRVPPTPVTLVATGSVWKYFDTGLPAESTWKELGFDDGNWGFGPGQLGYGDGDEATVVGMGPIPGLRAVTTYFRRIVEAPEGISNLLFRVLRDDGVVVYLNNSEVFRDNMPSTPVTFLTLASSAIPDPDENIYIERSIPAGLLTAGSNILAVEIHQASPLSTDVSFDLELIGHPLFDPGPGQVPRLNVYATDHFAAEYDRRGNPDPARFTIIRDGNLAENLAVNLGWSGTADPGADFVRIPNSILFPAGLRSLDIVIDPLPTDAFETLEDVILTLSPPSCSPDENSLDCYRVGDANQARVYISEFVPQENQPPLVQLISPVEDGFYPANNAIPLVATAIDPDFPYGDLIEVRFFANGEWIGSGLRANAEQSWRFDWNHVAPGEYLVSAQAIDGFGLNESLTTTSSPVRITVSGAIPGCAPELQWQESYGGWGLLPSTKVRRFADGGYLLIGPRGCDPDTCTNAGFGDADGYVARLDSRGRKVWEHLFGGLSFDSFNAVTLTPEGGCLLAGSSSSDPSGNKTSPRHGNSDAWLVRLDGEGRLLWEQTYGGATDSFIRDVIQLTDGGFLAVGSAKSDSDNVGYGLRVDPQGRRIWEKIFPYLGQAEFARVVPAPGGGFSIAGTVESGVERSGFWLVRLNASGEIIGENVYGNRGDSCRALASTSDDGLLLAGSSSAQPGEGKTSPAFGSNDFWVIRLDLFDHKLWERSFGGSGEDSLWDAITTADDGFVLAGATTSEISGNKTSPSYGGADYWIVHLDASGRKLAEATYGGTATDDLWDLEPTGDGGFLLAGTSESPISGNKTAPLRATSDVWLVKLGTGPECDEDGDGIADAYDDCADTGGEIVVDTHGCSLEQLCPCSGPTRNHGEYVACVIYHTWRFFRLGMIDANERRRLTTEAINSECGNGDAGGVRVHLLPLTAAELQRDGVQVVLSGAAGSRCLLETSTDLIHWSPVAHSAEHAAGEEIVCPIDNNSKSRFFRARAEP